MITSHMAYASLDLLKDDVLQAISKHVQRYPEGFELTYHMLVEDDPVIEQLHEKEGIVYAYVPKFFDPHDEDATQVPLTDENTFTIYDWMFILETLEKAITNEVSTPAAADTAASQRRA